MLNISIHALLTESDLTRFFPTPEGHKISIHALLTESDGGFAAGSWRLVIFLSTLSLRRATYGFCEGVSFLRNFYPRSPYGERPAKKGSARSNRNFYPRSPYGERQQAKMLKVSALRISIHALLTESDELLIYLEQN